MVNYEKVYQSFFNKTFTLVTVLIGFSAKGQNIIFNSSFEKKGELFYYTVGTAIENTDGWKGINSPDFYGRTILIDHKDYVGLSAIGNAYKEFVLGRLDLYVNKGCTCMFSMDIIREETTPPNALSQIGLRLMSDTIFSVDTLKPDLFIDYHKLSSKRWTKLNFRFVAGEGNRLLLGYFGDAIKKEAYFYIDNLSLSIIKCPNSDFTLPR